MQCVLLSTQMGYAFLMVGKVALAYEVSEKTMIDIFPKITNATEGFSEASTISQSRYQVHCSHDAKLSPTKFIKVIYFG